MTLEQTTFTEAAEIAVADEPEAPFVYNETFNTLFVTLSNGTFYMGAYKTFNTFSASATSYMTEANVDVSQFPARFISLDLFFGEPM